MRISTGWVSKGVKVYQRWSRWLVLGAAFASIGCGGDGKLAVYPAQGKVTLDGEPNGPAAFLMVPAQQDEKNPKPTVSGIVDSAGIITLSCYANGDGAPEGEYNVHFTPSLVGGAAKKPIPVVYGTPDGGSGLKIKIEPKSGDAFNDVSLTLDSKARGNRNSAAAAMGPRSSSALGKNYPSIDPSLMPKTSP